MKRILVLLSLTISLVSCVEVTGQEAKVLGLRLKSVSNSETYTDDGVISVKAGQEIDIEVIGVNLSPEVRMRLTTAVMEKGADCDTGSNETKLQSRSFLLTSPVEEGQAHFLKLNEGGENVIYSSSADTYRVCVQAENGTWVYQGDTPGLRIQFYAEVHRLIDIWLSFTNTASSSRFSPNG